MVMYKKVYDPGTTSRRLNVIVRNPDTLAGLAEIPYRQEATLIDFILHEWMLQHSEGKSVQEAINDGTLTRNIEETLHLAKKGRAGRTVPALSPAPSAQNSSAAVPVSRQPEPARIEQAPFAPVRSETPSVTLHETQDETLHETPRNAPGHGDEPPPPPSDIADRLNGMFDN